MIVQDPSEDGPPAKKSKTEDDLMPEDAFLKTNPVSVPSLWLIHTHGDGHGSLSETGLLS